uniref:Uncharacterized protein n=1 Tax=Triticum urartu TaxID=4572 RepID=A0A8R7VHR3_TRIUA
MVALLLCEVLCCELRTGASLGGRALPLGALGVAESGAVPLGAEADGALALGTPFLCLQVVLLCPLCLHKLHLITVPTLLTLLVFGFSSSSLVLHFFFLPGILMCPGAFGFGL